MGSIRSLIRVAATAALGAGIAVSVAVAPASAASASCDGVEAKVRKGEVVRGGPGPDVLIGAGASQTFVARGGDDRVCGGGGQDVIRGGGGDDVLHGDGRGDRLFGGAGADHVHGDILDDFLFGGGGPDRLIGGHGVDKMFGGGDNDLMRGGTNRDCFYGGAGENTASFATATPPGPPGNAVDGVRVDLAASVKGECPRRGTGRADGDGDAEALSEVQFVIGSAFDDSIEARGAAAIDAGLGADVCGPAAGSPGCGGGDERPVGTVAEVVAPVTAAPPDPGLVVLGAEGTGGQSLAISGTGAGARVQAGEPLVPGAGCDAAGACASSAALAFVLAWGDGGADAIAVGPGLPPSASVDLDGGPGDDSLAGSDYLGEVLFGGDSEGADLLAAGGGDDALVSEGGAAGGPDRLHGGAGDDQLVTNHPCAGHTFAGGSGFDVAGFARAAVGISARIGGRATLASGECGAGAASSVGRDNEVLEGTPAGDRLVGSGVAEQIWGREGNDFIRGRGGADELRGFAGRDLIDARDGRRDRLVQCGAGRDRAARVDRADPKPLSC
jgi:Ca2+-binding RTX toxin-like protein